MQPRKYAHYSVKNCASTIASEVIEGGKSEGWGGSLNELEQIKTVLNPLNIHYVDDYLGTWKHRIHT